MKTIDSISVECPCGTRAQLPAKLAGRRVRCTSCRGQLRVPGERRSSQRAYRRSEARSRRDVARSGGHPTPRGSLRRAQKASPYAPPKTPVARAEPKPPSSSKRAAATQAPPRRDLAGEAHVQAIGVWYRITAVILIGIMAFMLKNLEGQRIELLGCVLVGVSAFSWWLGSSLMRYERWARNVVGVTTLVGMAKTLLGVLVISSGGELLNVLIAGLWQVATLWVLFGGTSAAVFRDDYPSGHEPVEWAKSPFFWLPIVLPVLLFLVALLGSFRFAALG